MGEDTAAAGGGDTGELLIELRVRSRPDRLRLVRAAISEAGAVCGAGERCLNDLVIAVNEACQNVIRHAYGGRPDEDIIVVARREGGRLIVDVVDFAEPVDERSIRPRRLDELRPGGLGTHFIHQCVDEVRFEPPPAGAGNRLRLIKRIQ